MNVIDRGEGVPVIVIPGVQGRWEWHRPAIDALARFGRVLTFSLAGEPGSGMQCNQRSLIDCYCDQIATAMTDTGLARASLCGISYGGLVAAVFAARYPERVSSLILVSALPPTWTPNRRVQTYLRLPRLCTPVFMLSSLRLATEIVSASPHLADACATSARHAWNVLTHFFSPVRMAGRISDLATLTLTDEVRQVTAPTLVLIGEPHLDLVVPVEATLDYVRLLPQAQVATLARTGHLGSITRPDAFAELVASFAGQHSHSR